MGFIKYVSNKIKDVFDPDHDLFIHCSGCGEKFPKAWYKCPKCGKENRQKLN